ncbi:hypothetical protein HanXRQr2_Chr07g0306391 [Helianthus annuus]|uniref:Uncharacterized protein n=1 Tax=Helianthus annuus TaxID=4232 RepID=A0A9K3IMP6_HELAN|nr:hypothetical protein HanXRQr2_Chr07g0306391 [Helianthus annuus]KAJ0905664.1 hypothetical protein HanPSC8_Chr07g0296531 [Helianthus annuus]
MRRKSDEVARRSGFWHSLSGIKMTLVGGYGCSKEREGSGRISPVESSSWTISTRLGYCSRRLAMARRYFLSRRTLQFMA